MDLEKYLQYFYLNFMYEKSIKLNCSLFSAKLDIVIIPDLKEIIMSYIIRQGSDSFLRDSI